VIVNCQVTNDAQTGRKKKILGGIGRVIIKTLLYAAEMELLEKH
jgi:hypothetical protein